VKFLAVSDGLLVGALDLTVGGQGNDSVTILRPSITITKQCVTNCAPYSSPYGSPISFTGTVCNNGDTILNNVTVVDDPATSITFAILTSLANAFPAGGGGALLPGECVTYSGSYSPAGSGVALCGPFTDTVIASGTDTADVPLTVSATNSATCLVCTTPCVEVTKVCGPATLNFPASTSYTVSGAVTNCGNVPLTNVVVVDVVTNAAGVVTTNAVTTIPLLGITAADNFALLGPITINVEGCGPSSDYLAVTASGLCGGNVNDRSDTCTTTFLCPPDICVIKGVLCAPASGADCDTNATYLPSATGVAGPTNQAAFCYQIIVWNCGNDVLTNVTVVDDKIALVAGSFPTTLGIGEGATNYYQQSYGPDTSTTNVVTATGTGQSSGITTNKVAQAIANVLSLGVECDITLSSSGAVEGGNCEVTLDSNNGSNQPVTFTLVVTNTGKVDLDVSLVGVPALVDCQDQTNAVPVPASVLILVGQSYTVEGCVLVSCPGAHFEVTVQGTANAGTNGICIYDAEGHAVTTAPSQCTADVCCVSPVTCRTTGGGDLVPGYVNESCISVPTTLYPLTSATGLELTLVSHGGQLGAPYSHKDCGEVLGNPCIRGQWQHVRHYKGQGNPRDVVTALHTVTPKGEFDTLSCACLPCCDPETGAFIPRELAPGKHFELCNPEDHKICGPMPRPAPANALIWTGLGKMQQASDTGTKPAEWVIVRVYIEDRSEPGGGHPGGSVDPADIYSYQAWKTGIQVSKKPNFDAIAPAFRTLLGQDSCAWLDSLVSGQLPIGSLPPNTVGGLTADIYDQGPLHNGNRHFEAFEQWGDADG
jgi:hypothetical protein